MGSMQKSAADKSTVEKGRRAEDLAVEWLQQHGLQVIKRNWRHHHLEIDIIAKGPLLSSAGEVISEGCGLFALKEYIHIVEVRSRIADSSVAPAFTVDAKKQRLLVIAADSFVRQNHISGEVVFDILAIEFSAGKASIDFYPEAFGPQW